MAQPRILIVEDDLDWQDIYRRGLREAGYEIAAARKVSTALTLLAEQPFDVVITDLKMLGGAEEFSGFGVLEQARAIHPDVQVIVITGYGSADHALRAMGSGAYDYITKDRDLRKKLALAVQGALEARSLKQELLDKKDDAELESDRIIGNSASMAAAFEQIAHATDSDVNILIYGEGGTGKRLIAQVIHRQSQRKGGPFLVVDCGRLSESVLESELFGYEAGAFYGIKETRPGKFERARGGTIFLDSVGDLELQLQTRLLGAVRDRLVERVGGQDPIPIDVRIIASTDKDLEAMLSAGQFRRQLFVALDEFVISVPPLRERRDGDDIPALAAMFLQRHSQGRQVQFSPEAVALLQRYNYPGNVRELESAVKYALTLAPDQVILPEHLRPEIRNYEPPPRRGKLQKKKESKDPATILRICPLNLSACSKRDEILRLYSSRRVFVNVPYAPHYAQYELVIRRTLEKYGLLPVLSKDYLEPVVLLCNVCKLIQTCKYGVSDISGSDGNVLYELGLMHAIGIHCAILKERQTGLSADIQGLFFLEYTHADSMAERLSRWIEDQVSEASHSDVVVLPDCVPAPPPGPIVNILHISDIHRGIKVPTNNPTLRGKLLDDIYRTYDEDDAKLRPEEPRLGPPDIIVVSGDLSQRAGQAEYDKAREFLEGLLGLVGGDRERVVLVPGNHDVSWKISRKSYIRATEQEYEEQPGYDEPYRCLVKKDPKSGDYWRKKDKFYTARFEPFKAFFDDFYRDTAAAYTWSLDRDQMYTVYDYSQTCGLVIVGFNTCDEIDHLDRRAFINTDAIYRAEEAAGFHAAEGELLRIAVFHHNIRSVRHGEDFLETKYLQILKRHGFDLCLHGHVHTTNLDIFDPTQAKTLPVLGAGSLAAPYKDRPPAAPKSYNLIVINRENGGIWAHTRCHDEERLVWRADYRWDGKPYLTIRPPAP